MPNSNKEKSVLFTLFGQEKTTNDSSESICFMNDYWFAKTLEENFVAAKIYNLKSIPYIKRQNVMEDLIISELSGGTNVQFADGQVWERNALTLKEGHHISEKSIRKARATLVREHTEKINGNYILLAHPKALQRLRTEELFRDSTDEVQKKELKDYFIGEICDVAIVEMEQLPIYKNSKGEDIYCSFIFGEYAFGIKYLEKYSVCGVRRIDERHMVRIETVA